ncbi:MAG: hypothetical protein RIR00_2711, partial [Pseudomonadota bacterium]
GPHGPLDHFGGVAFTRAERTELQRYADLAGKHLLIPDRSSLGGWQMHVREALQQGLELEQDTAGIEEIGNHEAVVEGVLAGRADAGFIRADLLESLAAQGRLRLDQIRLLDSRQTPGYPYLHSTRLYPEWPLARVGWLPESLVRGVLAALLELQPEHPAARAAGIYGWTLPQNYQAIHELFREAHLGPYAGLRPGFQEMLTRYSPALSLLGLVLVIGLSLVLRAMRRSNRALRDSEVRHRQAVAVFDHALEGIIVTDTDGRITEVNATFSEITGYAHDEVIGQNPRMLSSGRHDAAFFQSLWQTLASTGIWRGEIWNRRKDGSLYPQATSLSAVRDGDGAVTHYIGLFSDVTQLKESHARLERMAYYDALTGLPNRLLLADRLRLALAHADRHREQLAVCYLDLDGFKPVNDQWGHAIGDALLVETGRRLLQAVRADDTVSRLGGDEFVLLLGSIKREEDWEIALQRIQDVLRLPFLPQHGGVSLAASIGITLYPRDSADPDTLLRHADQAMYSAKQAGRNRYMLFDPEFDRLHSARLENSEAMRRAIRQHEFCLYFQPKVDMRRGQVMGVEALVRWQPPGEALRLPAEFLHLVEEAGLQVELGEWVLRSALRQMQQWAESGAPLSVSINLAAEHLQKTSFVDDLRRALSHFPAVDPHLLELEIVETTALQDLRRVAGLIQECRGLGVQFAVDDFGTGYSSLSYLKQLPMQTLKIDRSFVHDMLEDPDDLAIVDGVVGLGHAFRRRVIAEGVESEAHGELLLRLGCEYGQGYGIALPMPAEALPQWLESWRAPASWKDIPRWPSAAVSLLSVELDLSRWINQLETALCSDADAQTLPEMLSSRCRFGVWLSGEFGVRYGRQPIYRSLVELHDRLHDTGQELVKLHAIDPIAARQRLPEIQDIGNALRQTLAQLRVIAGVGKVGG